MLNYCTLGVTAKIAFSRWLMIAGIVSLFCGSLWAQSDTTSASVAVPNVVGTTMEDAVASLLAADLQFETTEKETTDVPNGQIISQDPQAGVTVEEGAVVGLVVAVGKASAPDGEESEGTTAKVYAVPPPANVTVPNVVGVSMEEAAANLQSVKLLFQATKHETAETPDGQVMDQEPEAGVEVEEGETVELVVAAAPPPVKVTVPDLLKMDVVDAATKLQSANLLFEIQEGAARQGVPGGQVEQQTPSAGEEVNEGTTVKLQVTATPAPVKITVPNVLKMSVAAAAAKLGSAGLPYKATKKEAARGYRAGQVQGQNPRSGAKVDKGTVVTLVEAVTPRVAVPNVLKKSVRAAAASLRSAGLGYSATKRTVARGYRAGQVQHQYPRAGARVNKGTKVRLAEAVVAGDMIVAAHSGKCLDVYRASKSNGANVVQWKCHGGASQRWIYTTKRELRNVHSGLCLDVSGGSKGNGAKVHQWRCHGGRNQRWARNTRYGSLVSYNSGKCLDVHAGHGKRDGGKVQQWQCNKRTNQRWSFRK